MLERLDRIERFVQGMDLEGFLEDLKTSDSVVRNLEVIGEAASRLPRDYRDAHPGVPWHQVTGLRNRIVHAYFDVDLEIVWSIVETELPRLRIQVQALIAGLPSTE